MTRYASRLEASPESLIQSTLTKLQRRFKKSYPWSLGKGRALPNAYVLPKRKKQFLSGRPIVSFFAAPFRPMLNCIAKLICQILPMAFPHNLAKGDVFELTLHRKSTTKTLQVSSRALTRIASSPVGILRYTSSAPP